VISVTILTKNSAETLGKTLMSVKDFPEVLVLDTGSTDETIKIAEQFPNVRVCTHAFQGFGPTHNIASSLATHDYILSLDSDEVLSPELSQEILHSTLDPGVIYGILRKNYLRGKWIRGCAGWHPDWVYRLYHRKTTQFDQAEVHEKIIQGPLRMQHLRYTMDHEPYRKIEDFLHKMQSYSSLFAKQHRGKKSASVGKAIFHGLGAFIKSYIFKRGCLLGQEGFIISVYNGHTAFYKYLKLLEANSTQAQ